MGSLLKMFTPEKLASVVSQFQALPIETSRNDCRVSLALLLKRLFTSQISLEAYANMSKVLSMSIQAEAQKQG
jgi:hypothetical protein